MATCIKLILVLGLIIGAECQNVRLVGGPPDMPNAGRIELSINETWHEICYRGDNTSDSTWSIQNVISACRQLGYPGAALAGGGRFGDGLLGQSVDDFRCKGDEKNLLQCPHDSPRNVSCQTNDTAYAICTVPGYLGCFVDQLPRAMPYGGIELPNDMSITRCIEYCLNIKGIPRFAGVQDARQCFCGMNDTEYDRHGKAAEEDCSQHQCPGNENQACGSIWKMAVYDMSKGYCEDLKVPPNCTRFVSESYPQFGSSALFVCEPGFVLFGQNVTQCVLGRKPDEVTWSGDEPFCADERYLTTISPSSDISSSTEDEKDLVIDKSEKNRKSLLLAVLLGVLGFVLFIFILVVIILLIFFVGRGRKKTRHRHPVHPKTTEEARVNEGYADDTDPNSTRIVTVSNGRQHPLPNIDLTAHENASKKDVVVEDPNCIHSNTDDSGVAGLGVDEDQQTPRDRFRTSQDSGSSLGKEDEMCDSPDELLDELKEAKQIHIAADKSREESGSKLQDNIKSDGDSIGTTGSDNDFDETDAGSDGAVRATVPEAADSSSNNDLETVSSGYNSEYCGTVIAQGSSDETEGMDINRTEEDSDGNDSGDTYTVNTAV